MVKNDLLFGGQSLEEEVEFVTLCLLCDLRHFVSREQQCSPLEKGHGGRRVRKITLVPRGSEYFPGCITCRYEQGSLHQDYQVQIPACP